MGALANGNSLNYKSSASNEQETVIATTGVYSISTSLDGAGRHSVASSGSSSVRHFIAELLLVHSSSAS